MVTLSKSFKLLVVIDFDNTKIKHVINKCASLAWPGRRHDMTRLSRIASFATKSLGYHKKCGRFLRLHLGIGALQSGAIGAFFLPNLAAYVVGFGDFRDGNEPLKNEHHVC